MSRELCETSDWGKWWFAFIWNYLSRIFHFSLSSDKEKLFEKLSQIQSKDVKLREQRSIRILEIGIADGANLDYYPAKTHLIGVDKNDYFKQQLMENIKQKNLVFEKFLNCSAEHLADIADDSIDVVVSTLVLCSVGDPLRVVSEVHRVLAPGGKWFIIEHGIFEDRPMHNFFQKLVNPIFNYLFDGCNLDRNIAEYVNYGQFEQVNIEHKQRSIFGVTATLMSWYIGTATK